MHLTVHDRGEYLEGVHRLVEELDLHDCVHISSRFVPITDCIRNLYYNRGRLSELAHNTTKFNQHYNWTSQSAQYVALVDNLACSSKYHE